MVPRPPASPPSPWHRHLRCSALFLFICLWVTSEANEQIAELPPRGWNSYDSFSWTVDENAYMQNAKILAEKLLPLGYQYAVIDFLWYRRYVDGAYIDLYGFDNIDEWGRPFPDLQRFPSSKGDKGFSQIANKVHEMGLKFGIHLMKGISTQAVNANTPILDIETGKPYVEDGRQWAARDIGLTHRTCAWMPHGFMSVNTDIGAGRAFLKSIYRRYADWGVDFVKVDCILGTDYSPKEIIPTSLLPMVAAHFVVVPSHGRSSTSVAPLASTPSPIVARPAATAFAAGEARSGGSQRIWLAAAVPTVGTQGWRSIRRGRRRGTAGRIRA